MTSLYPVLDYFKYGNQFMPLHLSFHRILPLAIFFYTSWAAAAVLDGGEIRFQGYVTDEAPKWTWQIASQDQSWTVDTADARRVGNTLHFDLQNYGLLPFLEGHLYQVVDRGGPGLSPHITFSSQGHSFTLLQGASMTDQRFRAFVPVTDPESGLEVGELRFSVEQGLGVVLGPQSEGGPAIKGMSLAEGESITQVQSATLSSALGSRLSSLILQNREFSSDMTASSNGQRLNQSLLSASNVMNIAAAYASSLSDFELMLPASGTPARWRARLAVTVTVQ